MASDAFQAARALAEAARRGDTSIALNIPEIPLWVEAKQRDVINRLTVGTIRLALAELAGHVSDRAADYSDTGHLAQSFSADPATQEGGIELLGVDVSTGLEGRVFSALPYAVVVDQGRRPGAPISIDGIDAIGLWAQRKLGLSAEEAEHAKYAIANQIVAQGLEGRFFVEAGFDAARPRIEVMFSVLANELAAAMVGGPGGGGQARDARGRFIKRG